MSHTRYLDMNTNQTANIIGQILAPLLFIAYYLVKKILQFIIRFWKVEFRLALITYAIFLIVPALTNTTYAPTLTYATYAHPQTQREQIINYIIERFGKEAPNAFKVLACENHRLNPSARGMNTNGTSDVGIFQVNSVHGVPESYLKDWHTNIDVAYQIYKASGWNAWACVTEYNSLERDDTI
jgi:hypothetical protein